MINTGEEAAQVVSWAKFPPMGTRSFGSAYAGLAFGQSMPEYLKAANEQTMAAVQIESKLALDNLDAIFSTPHLDMAFVGPIDLSISLGLDPLPENPHPVFAEAIESILAAADRYKVPLGIYCSSPQAARERIAQGFLFVNVTSDIGALLGGVRQALEGSH
jgi:4-hydroxy-2-oxoheptanedioate aldolase